MEFRYSNVKHRRYEPQLLERHRYEMFYSLAPAKPPWDIVEPTVQSMRPFEDSSSLADRIFAEPETQESDSILSPIQRARIQGSQVSILLEQLSARHAINRKIRKDLEYTECRISSKLTEIQERPFGYGGESKFESDLIKELDQIQGARHAEYIACWRDTNRLLSDVFEGWNDYQENNRKARMMDLGL